MIGDCSHGVPGDMFCGACEDEEFVRVMHEKCRHGVLKGSGCPVCLEDELAQTPNMLGTDVDAVLKERGSRYGKFTEHARITQNIKRAMADSPNWATLPDDTKETLEMLAHKVGRVLNGDPEYADNFIDIAGYAKLVADRMGGKIQ